VLIGAEDEMEFEHDDEKAGGDIGSFSSALSRTRIGSVASVTTCSISFFFSSSFSSSFSGSCFSVFAVSRALLLNWTDSTSRIDFGEEIDEEEERYAENETVEEADAFFLLFVFLSSFKFSCQCAFNFSFNSLSSIPLGSRLDLMSS
jgi:hypothetical protein